jgi:hypothetical protein
LTLELEHKVRRVFAANCAIADAFDGTLWDACGGGMMASAALAEGALVRDVQFRLNHYHLAECALAAGDDRGAMDKLSDTVKALDGESEWSVNILRHGARSRQWLPEAGEEYHSRGPGRDEELGPHAGEVLLLRRALQKSQVRAVQKGRLLLRRLPEERLEDAQGRVQARLELAEKRHC